MENGSAKGWVNYGVLGIICACIRFIENRMGDVAIILGSIYNEFCGDGARN